ncbi:endonuclease domain-containing protein [Lysobacter koreensis]|uniref:Endonuclease domain-containing protein n=1 Tax=Lysobacter koreensis TaxID=266122 RepID=A0ABW2YR37_9GAMM
MQNYDRRLKPYSRSLRCAMTDAEQRLWYRVRRKQIAGVPFYRQKPLGPFIVDFYAPAAGLVVELDGAQHFTDGGRMADALRDAALGAMGLSVLRFDDRQVLLETEGVVEVIWRVVVERMR